MSAPLSIAVYFTIWWVVLFAILPIGVRSMTEAGVTVSSVDPLTPPRVAVIVAVPLAREVPSALELMIAMAEFPELHATELVRS